MEEGGLVAADRVCAAAFGRVEPTHAARNASWMGHPVPSGTIIGATMKELLAGFAVDIFRPVVTLVVPGFWALTPWIVAMFLCCPSSWVFANAHPDGSGIAIVVAGTTAGLLFEDLGVRLENLFFKRT